MPMSVLKRVAAVIGIFLFSACATSGLQTKRDLNDTRWKLLAIQSMDDAQGTTSIKSPELYTLRFVADRRATLQLDCNRASASWRSSPASADDRGGIEFGEVAMTRAMCPPGSYDQRIARDLAFVRSYVLKDGKLFLSLFADGGIYEWAPINP